jgi:hypothetical protein
MLHECKFDRLKPSGNYSYNTTWYKIKELCILPKQRYCNFRTILTPDTDYVPKQH